MHACMAGPSARSSERNAWTDDEVLKDAVAGMMEFLVMCAAPTWTQQGHTEKDSEKVLTITPPSTGYEDAVLGLRAASYGVSFSLFAYTLVEL